MALTKEEASVAELAAVASAEGVSGIGNGAGY